MSSLALISRVVCIAVTAVIAALALPCDARAADPELVAAARREGQVTWYTTQIMTQFGRPAMDAFQARYGIKVDAIRGDSVELAIRMINEARAGRLLADVFDGTNAAPALKKAGVALKWQPDGIRAWPQEYRDPQGTWVATNMYVHTPAYNTSLVPKADAPRTWQDLLEAKWRGKMAWAVHATTSGGPGFVGLVLTELGEEKGRAYLSALAQQRIVALGGSARSVTDQAIAGEYPLVLQVFNHQAFISAERGAPVAWIPMNPSMAILSVAGVTAPAPHPNAGKLLVDFLVSDEGQSLFRSIGYIRVAPQIAPRDPALRPDGKTFRGTFFSPEAIDTAMPHWNDVFNEIFR
jgi:ABC-type Fe3+ transport system substrate-binding protein